MHVNLNELQTINIFIFKYLYYSRIQKYTFSIYRKTTEYSTMRLFVICHVLLVISTALSMAMYMPEDTEILDGYVLDDGVDQISPEDMYFEVRSLTGHARRPIRNKRDAKYEVLQSAGLSSHFIPKTAFKRPQMVPQFGSVRRVARSARIDKSNAASTDETAAKTEELPIAEKQIQMDQHYAEDQVAFASDTQDRWTTAPFEYTKLQRQNTENTMAPSRPEKEGIKNRTPRVHFVTQQKKQTEDKFAMMMGGDLNVASANNADSYRKNARTERLEEENRGRYLEYDTYNRHYDR